MINKVILSSLGLGYLIYKLLKPININKNYFSKKTILISGASSGIGKEISNILSKLDCNLILMARSLDNKNEGNIIQLKCDCGNYQMVKDALKSTNKPIDIVIHCAGLGDWKFLTEMSINEINNCLDAPLKSAINLTHLTLPKMLEKNDGQIIFVESPVVIQPWASCTAYSLSRWGMKGLAESLKADLYNKNITVSEIILGRTESNYFKTNKTADSRFPLIGKIIRNITPFQAAMATIWMIQNKKEYYYYPFMMKIVIYLQYYFPFIVRFLTYKTSFYTKDYL